MEKTSANGEVTCYLQAVGAALVHPDFREVISLCPEIIKKQDGAIKMDCERNAIRRMLGKLRPQHPHMKFIVNGDSLQENYLQIRTLSPPESYSN